MLGHGIGAPQKQRPDRVLLRDRVEQVDNVLTTPHEVSLEPWNAEAPLAGPLQEVDQVDDLRGDLGCFVFLVGGHGLLKLLGDGTEEDVELTFAVTCSQPICGK